MISPNLQIIADIVLNDIEKRIQDSESKQFSDEELLTLHSIYGCVLQRALDIFEKTPILETYSTENKTRVLIEVKGENDHCYRVFSKFNYCTCLAFKHHVLDKRSQITCKHVLAGKIAFILGKTIDREVTQEQYLMLVQSMFDLDT